MGAGLAERPAAEDVPESGTVTSENNVSRTGNDRKHTTRIVGRPRAPDDLYHFFLSRS